MSRYFLLAYIDPVSGSILIQVVFAAVAGTVAFFHRSVWRVMRRIRGPKEPTATDRGQGGA